MHEGTPGSSITLEMGCILCLLLKYLPKITRNWSIMPLATSVDLSPTIHETLLESLASAFQVASMNTCSKHYETLLSPLLDRP